MDRKKFNEIIDDLLIKGPKESVQHQKQSKTFREDSLKLKPKPTPKICQDCGKPTPNRVIWFIKKEYATGHRFWIKECVNCGEKWPIDL